MLLKYSQAQKRFKTAGIGKPQRTTGGMVKLTSGLTTTASKAHRKVIKVASKRPATVHRIPIAKKREQIPLDPCDNSNDSGLGFDHHLDFHNPPHFHAAPHPALRFSEKEVVWPSEGSQVAKRQRLDIKLESDDANDNFTFPETLRRPPVSRTVCMPVRPRRVLPVTLTSQLTASSQNGLVQLLIACQPETQHRARYQTEGSRGAVKDRSGNGFPVVKLLGYDRPATLQVFIGTDQGRVAPHMFYQACRVSGKNSTPCVEKKIDGTIVIEVDIEPSKDMVVTCDCVGILKERNVDVEHRFPEEGSSRSKKKSTRCRMVFRTTITNLDGTQETLQVTSQPIVCTQPPGVPEICKKSLSSCSVHGGQELFVLGKNFLKDTRVVFQEGDPSNPTWSQSVQPDKEFLQQSHLVCVVPPYRTSDIAEPVILRLIIESSGKSSEPHTFTYLPDGLTLSPVVKQSSDNHRVLTQETIGTNPVVESGTSGVYCSPRASVPPLLLPTDTAAQFMATGTKTLSNENVPVHPVMMWDKHMEVMMPPPPAIPIPMANRHSSIQLIVPDPLSPENLKTEAPESLEEPKPFASVSDLSTTRPPSMDTFHRFVSNNSLPSINVGNYLSNIEGSSVYANKAMNAQLMHKVPHIMIRPTAPNLINKPVQSLESSNLLTTAETTANLTSRVPFESRNLPSNQSTSHAYQEGLSVIVSSSMIQKKLPSSDIVPNNVPGSHSVGMKILIPPILTKEEPTMTEKLDAFINSTADSHISPKPVSPTLSGNHINGESSDGSTSEANQINTLQETFSTEMRSPLAPINLSSSHQGSRSLDDESVCSLVRSPSSLNNTEINCTSQTSVNNQMMNQSLSCQAEVIHSPPQQQQLTSQPQSFPSGSVSLDEQMLTSQSVSSQMNHELNLLMQSQTVSSTNQSTSVLQSALDQVSSQLINSNKQLCLSDINNLTHGNSINQIQGLPNFQTSLEQHLSSQTMSSQINNCNLNNLVNSSPSSSRSEALNSLQISLTQHQNVTSALVNHSHPTNNHQSELKEVSLSSDQGFSNLQVTYEQHHLNSQLSHKSMEFQSDSLKLNNLAPKDLEVAERVNAQTSAEEALSNFKASLNHHLSPQMISSCHSNHESESRGLENLNCAVSTSTQVVMNQSQVFSNLQNTLEHLTTQTITSQQSLNSLPTNSITTSLDTSQAQVLSDIQMSLRQLNSQSLTSLQDLNPVTSGSVSLERSIDNPPIQVSTSEGSQVLSNFSPAIEQQLATSNILTTPHTNALEMQNSVQLNSIDVNLQPTSNLQTNLGNFSSNSSQNLLVESMAPSSYLSSNTSNPVMTSPTSCHNPSLALNHPKNGISQTSPEMILQSTAPLPQPSMDLHGSLPVESQNAAQFNSTSAVQMAAMNQFEQRSACHESNRSSTFTITTQTAGAEPQSSISTVRKSEKGIPMPVTTNEITEMSENDLLRFINPRCFDTV